MAESLKPRVERLEEAMERSFVLIHALTLSQLRLERSFEDRDKKTDERIGKLVLSIGELIQEMREDRK